MTNGTVYFAGQVALVAEQYGPFRMGRHPGLIGIAVALGAALFSFEVMTVRAHVHRGQIPVPGQSAGLNISVAVRAFHIGVQSMGKNDIPLSYKQLGAGKPAGQNGSSQEQDQH
jgi:hypothetical protein